MNQPLDFKNYYKIPLFYWSERRFIFRDKENYGDLLSKYLVEKISGKEVEFVHPKNQPWYKIRKKNLLAAGSIIHHASKDSIVWGSGIIDYDQRIEKANFRAVRGPRTRDYLLNLGYDCPEIFGDPAILLPDYYNPEVTTKYPIGVIPHYHDLGKAREIFGSQEEVKIIDLLTLDIEATTRDILECETVLSTSLHGLIVAQAYGIPAVWIKMSDKIFGNDIKYADYLESVGLEAYESAYIKGDVSLEEISDLFRKYPTLVSEENLNELRSRLLEVKPF